MRFAHLIAAVVVSLAAASGASAIEGTDYTVVTPIYLGENNNTSFLRIYNGDATQRSFPITVVGGRTGRVVGSTQVTVASKASPQFSVRDMVNTVRGNTQLDEPVSIYIQNGNAASSYQHVIYNSASGFFENMTSCEYVAGSDYSALNKAVRNAHSTIIPAYPSIISVHNLSSEFIIGALDVYNAANGLYQGTVSHNFVSNEIYTISVQALQTGIGWNPGAADFHVNVVLRADDPAKTFKGTISQVIFNSLLSSNVNMTTSCPLNR